MQHRADAGDAEIELEMAVGVPGDGADPVTELDAQPLERWIGPSTVRETTSTSG
jgi:hypothetical protein